MSDEQPGSKPERLGPTPEEQAEFEQRLETMAGFEALASASATAETEALTEQIKEAEARGDRAKAERLKEKRSGIATRYLVLIMAIIVALIVAVAWWATGRSDTTRGLADGGDRSRVAEIAPPQKADTPAEVLPAEVFTYTCSDGDMTSVTQVPLHLNPAAKYQFGYDAGGSRIAVFSVVEGDQYDAMAESVRADYAKAKAAGDDVEPPRELSDLGDAALIYGSTVVFRKGADAALLWANTLEDAGGEASVTIKTDELEDLARIAAPRM